MENNMMNENKSVGPIIAIVVIVIIIIAGGVYIWNGGVKGVTPTAPTPTAPTSTSTKSVANSGPIDLHSDAQLDALEKQF